MEAENSLEDFNRTKCSRSRFQSTSSSEKKLSDTRRSRYPPQKKLSDTRYKDEKKSKKKSKKKSEKKLSDTRYKEEKKSSSSDDDVEYNFSYGHKHCGHGITRKDLKPFNKYFKQVTDSGGYEASFIPGGFCNYVTVFPCDVDAEGEFLNETCRKCIAEYNKKHTEEPDYELLDVVMATKKPVSGFNYYITFRARQVHLPDVVKTSRQVHIPDVVKTFRARCYRRLRANYGEVHHCELKD